MKKTWGIYFLILFYLEAVFHATCFNELSVFNILLFFFFTLVFSILFTIVTSALKNTRINSILMKILIILITIIFASELVYFKIYESFFSINGLFFVKALKDGYDKVFLTIFQNGISIILLIIPIILIFIYLPKNIPSINKKEAINLFLVMLLGIGYSTFSIFNINKEDDYSLYNLFFNVNMPILNVKNFGLLTSSCISVERKFLGFDPTTKKSEDIFTNKKTILADDINIKYNEDNIIFPTDTDNSKVNEISNYLKNQPLTMQNKFTGMFKDMNVIFIVAESFDEIAINKELTPTLYKMKENGIKFNNYFAPKYPASTADGEFMLEWSMLPIIGEDYSLIDMVYNTNPYLLPRKLKGNGYSTYVYHNYTGDYNRRKKYFSTLGFDKMRYCKDGINMECNHFHGSDIDMIEQSVGDYINKDKFFTYYITLSGHGSYDSTNFVANKHINKLTSYNYPSSLKYYLAANIDFDKAMEKLLSSLEVSNKLDNTLIVISSDHSPYYLTNNEVNLLSKMDRSNKFDRNRGSLVIYNSKLKGEYQTDKYAMNIDVLPTIYNMLGLTYDSRLMIGKDIMDPNTDGLVILADRSFANNYGSYDSATNKFNPYVSGIDEKYIQKVNQDVNDKFQISVSMQYNDYYKYIFK